MFRRDACSVRDKKNGTLGIHWFLLIVLYSGNILAVCVREFVCAKIFTEACTCYLLIAARMPRIKSIGVGGQPRMTASTGITLAMAPQEA
jgi:hypothetical protein